MPGLGRHLCSGETAAAKGVYVVSCSVSYLDMEKFRGDQRTDTNGSTLTYVDLARIYPARIAIELAFPTMPGDYLNPEHAMTGITSTALGTRMEANIWHSRRLGHPSE